MGWFSPKCPVGEQAGAWIEESMGWFRDQFGDDPLGSDVVLPADLYTDDFNGTDAEVQELLDRLCGHFAVDPEWVTLEITPFAESGLDGHSLRAAPPPSEHRHRREDGRQVSEIYPNFAPFEVVARFAHDLCYARLLGEERIDPERRDREPLADLMTVYFGLGVITANACFAHAGTWVQRIGFMSEPMFGYGLACYAWLRGESWPDWADHLQPSPQSSMDDGLRYLSRVAEPGELRHPVDNSPG
jgi:hypothetical protein